ncbi:MULTISPECIES: glucosaminidase domain-containing protein [unclassified Staphylococcus]|uniref:glucosaminidase domain-containing protein n=1 Tax=unclassified Staphylococcus TaxID=91994 RepID=UPI0021D1A2A8|nr:MULTISPECIES: glucosaminidase domain-containing protein [unclassified Staphylococcus]UXR78213.1 glucosaminidase domain-containing protein [Staphylococcus sp. IVB6227]UXR82377.1 glucosaminidase domain-containing protein [Staphylococcus sp. IVB6214]
MKGKVLCTALLSTALVATPTTSGLAEAVTQKAQTALEQDETQRLDDTTTDSPLDMLPDDDNNDTSHEKEDQDAKTHKREKSSVTQDDNTTDSSLMMDAFDQWLYQTALGRPSPSANDTDYPDIQNESPQNVDVDTEHAPSIGVSPAPTEGLSTDERDFFDNLSAILNEETPFDDIVSEDDDMTDDIQTEDEPTETDPVDDETNTTQDEPTETNSVDDETDTTQDDIDETLETPADDEGEETTDDNTQSDDSDDITNEGAESDDENDITDAPTDDTNTVTQEGETSKKDDVIIEALLDQYSDKAEKTQAKQQKTQSEKQNVQNPQIPSKDAYTGSRQQAPAQTFDDLPKHSPARQTTWFQEYAPAKHGADTGAISDIRVAPNQSTREFINDIAEDAHRIGQEQDLYASIMIAQAILESDSGRSALAQSPNHNLFGIKGTYHGQKAGFNTLESNGRNMYQIQADFRKYPNKKASLEDYAHLIKGGIDGNPTIYKGVWKSESSSYRTAVTELVGTYATDPNYDTKLKQLIQTYDLTRFDQKKMPRLLESNIVSTGKDVSGSGFKTFHTSGHSPYPQGQCTWYVYHRMAQFGKPIAGNMGNAGEWTNAAHTKGYKVTKQPTKQSTVVFRPGQLGANNYYGHVAFVEQVHDDGSIVISESNVKGLGVISYRTIDATSAQSLDYIVR